MSQWILKANGQVVPRRTSRPLKVEEIHSVSEQGRQTIFDGLIARRWGTSINPPAEIGKETNDNEFEEYEDLNEPKRDRT